MENKQAIAELKQIYGFLSPDKQLALDVAFKAMREKSEWEQDHDILKAYSDGFNNAVDTIKDDIINNIADDLRAIPVSTVIRIIDKYRE